MIASVIEILYSQNAAIWPMTGSKGDASLLSMIVIGGAEVLCNGLIRNKKLAEKARARELQVWESVTDTPVDATGLARKRYFSLLVSSHESP